MSRRPSAGAMARRAVVLRCPWCGSRRTFIRRWLGKYPRCRSCGIRWHREEGFELGAMTLNTIMTFVVVVAVMAVALVATVPDVPVVPMVVGLGVLGVVTPVLFFPLSYTLWLAFDLLARPPEEDELAEARRAVAAAVIDEH